MRFDINNTVTVGSTACGEPTATLLVFAKGRLRDQIIAIGEQQADFDRLHRRVIAVREMDGPVAMVVNDRNDFCVFLDEWQATSAAWIEDAFLRARRAALPLSA